MTTTTQPTTPTEERIDIPTWATITLAVGAGPDTADAIVYGAFAVHIGGFDADQFGEGPVTNHRFYFNVTHVASGYGAAIDLENREAHYLARAFAACPAFVALCDARGAGADMAITPEVAEWFRGTLRDAAMTYGAYAEAVAR